MLALQDWDGFGDIEMGLFLFVGLGRLFLLIHFNIYKSKPFFALLSFHTSFSIISNHFAINSINNQFNKIYTIQNQDSAKKTNQKKQYFFSLTFTGFSIGSLLAAIVIIELTIISEKLSPYFDSTF